MSIVFVFEPRFTLDCLLNQGSSVEIIQIYYRHRADRRPSPTWPQPGSLGHSSLRGPLTTWQVRLGKGKESEKGGWDPGENKGSSTALASSQSLLLLEESRAVFLDLGEPVFRDSASTVRPQSGVSFANENLGGVEI